MTLKGLLLGGVEFCLLYQLQDTLQVHQAQGDTTRVLYAAGQLSLEASGKESFPCFASLVSAPSRCPSSIGVVVLSGGTAKLYLNPAGLFHVARCGQGGGRGYPSRYLQAAFCPLGLLALDDLFAGGRLVTGSQASRSDPNKSGGFLRHHNQLDQ